VAKPNRAPGKRGYNPPAAPPVPAFEKCGSCQHGLAIAAAPSTMRGAGMEPATCSTRPRRAVSSRMMRFTSEAVSYCPAGSGATAVSRRGCGTGSRRAPPTPRTPGHHRTATGSGPAAWPACEASVPAAPASAPSPAAQPPQPDPRPAPPRSCRLPGRSRPVPPRLPAGPEQPGGPAAPLRHAPSTPSRRGSPTPGTAARPGDARCTAQLGAAASVAPTVSAGAIAKGRPGGRHPHRSMDPLRAWHGPALAALPSRLLHRRQPVVVAEPLTLWRRFREGQELGHAGLGIVAHRTRLDRGEPLAWLTVHPASS
jgi:hypothetical protein